MRYIIVFVLSLILLIVSSCGLTEDINKTSMPEHFYDVAVPVAKANVTISDFFKISDTTEFLSIDDNNFITIIYKGEMGELSGADYVSLSDFNSSESFTMEGITIPEINANIDVLLGDVSNAIGAPFSTTIDNANGANAPFPAFGPQSAGAYPFSYASSLSSVDISQGDLTMTVNNGFPVEIANLQMDIRDLNSMATIASFNFTNIPAGSSSSQTTSLAGKTLSNNLDFALINIESTGSGGANVPIDKNDALGISISTQNLQASGGTGVINSQTLIDTTVYTNYATSGDERLEKIIFKSGALDYDIDMDFREDVIIYLNMPGLSLNGVPFSEQINLNYSGSIPMTHSGSLDLEDYELDLSNGGITNNTISCGYIVEIVSSGSQTSFTTNDQFSFSSSITNLDFQYVEGYLGSFEFESDKDTVDFGVNTNMFGAEVYFEEPTFNLNVENSFGIPICVELTEKLAVKTSQNTQIELTGSAVDDSIDIAYPNLSQTGQYASTLITLDKNTSNIADVLSTMPDQGIFQVKSKANPSGDTTVSNFLLDTSKIKIDLDMTVPFYGRILSLVLQDTVDLTLQDFDQAEYAIFHLVTENSFPADIGLQLYFMDDNYVVLDSLIKPYISIFESAQVDDTGDVVANTKAYHKIQVDKASLYQLSNASKLMIQASLVTANDGNTPVRIYTDYDFFVQLGLQMNVKINP